MRALRSDGHNIGMLILMLMLGAIVGTLVGDALTAVIPWLKWSNYLELEPFKLNLVAFTFTFGFALKVNGGGILGMLLAFWLYWRN